MRIKMSRSINFIRFGVLTISLLFANAILADNLVQVTTPAAQNADSTINFAQLGGDQTLLGSSASVTSSAGLATGVAFTGPNSVISVVCTTAPPTATTNCSWTGSGFPKGDSVLWSSDAANGGNGPITLTFPSGISGVGEIGR